MPSLVLVGHDARTDATYSVDDLPGTSGRLDVLVRAWTTGLLTSHGIRDDWTVDLVLGGPPDPPKRVAVDGAEVENLNPDERSTALLLRKVLDEPAPGKVLHDVRPGIAVSGQGLAGTLDDRGSPVLVLDEAGRDVEDVDLPGDGTFVVSDHRDLVDADRHVLDERDALPVSLGPTALHAHQAVAVLQNRWDRRRTARR